jgi:proteasome lid subunit RPN8/RPN11
MGDILRVHRAVLEKIRKAALESLPPECCGLLAGVDGVITCAFAAPNALASPTAYEIAPKDLFRLMREIRAAGLTLLGIYHSHPKGNNEPSATDLTRAYYTDAFYVIVSPLPSSPRPIRAFRIRDSVATEFEILPVEP